MAPRSPHILVVGTGTIGGIGRFESLLMTALSDLAESAAFTYSSIWRRQHPSYLGGLTNPSGGGPRSTARFVLDVGRAVRQTQPELVLFLHVNLARTALLTRVLGARRYAVCAYGIDVWSPLDWLRNRSLRKASAVLSISHYTADQLRATQGVAAERIHVIPLALEPHWLYGGTAPRPDVISEPSSRLLSVSRLEPEARDKGIDAVIRVLRRVLAEVPSLEYRIVGEGADKPYLEDLARKCGVGQVVRFLGALPHEQLMSEYTLADAFVLPSATEGFGLVFLEAMAYAKPVVARNAGAVPEVVEDGQTGLLINDDDQLAHALVDLLTDPSRARAMGQKGRARADGVFSLATFEGRLESTLSAAVA